MSSAHWSHERFRRHYWATRSSHQNLRLNVIDNLADLFGRTKVKQETNFIEMEVFSSLHNGIAATLQKGTTDSSFSLNAIRQHDLLSEPQSESADQAKLLDTILTLMKSGKVGPSITDSYLSKLAQKE